MEELVDKWRAGANFILGPNTDFALAVSRSREIDKSIDIVLIFPFVSALSDQCQQIIADYIASYGVSVSIQKGVTYARDLTIEADVVVAFPLDSDVGTFCVEFANDDARAGKLVVCVPNDDAGSFCIRTLRERYAVQTVPLALSSLLAAEDSCRFGVDLVRECSKFVTAAVASADKKFRTENTVVVLIHGIRTRAMWQESVKRELERHGMIVIKTNFKYFDLVRFLQPFERFKQKPVDLVWQDICSAKSDFPKGRISILAHSFGTWIFAKILRTEEGFYERVALCGSVLKLDFDFAPYRSKFGKIINDVGTRDVWPTVAAKISGAYGPSGSFGFNRGVFVVDRVHDGYDHSSFLTADFCRQHWSPFFLDGVADQSSEPVPAISKLVQRLDTYLPRLFPTTLVVCVVVLVCSFYLAVWG